MEIRTLRSAERGALLDLLDGWDVGDGWRGRDFFARYVYADPSFRDDNVFVAIDGSEIVSCVQVFPREMRLAGTLVPLGGIGSVYTREDRRRAGIGERTLAAATAGMRSAGLEVGMLFAGPVAWYERQGWAPWPVTRHVLRCDEPPDDGALPFVRERDLAGVRRLHEAYSAGLDGTLLRSDSLWEASLENSGNPDETFRVVRQGNEIVAYTRRTKLSGFQVLLEAGRAPGAAPELARLIAGQVDRHDGHLVAPDLAFEPGLEEALARHGVKAQATQDATGMLICLDAAALTRRLDVPAGSATPNGFLAEHFPPACFHFWSADRF